MIKRMRSHLLTFTHHQTLIIFSLGVIYGVVLFLGKTNVLQQDKDLRYSG